MLTRSSDKRNHSTIQLDTNIYVMSYPDNFEVLKKACKEIDELIEKCNDETLEPSKLGRGTEANAVLENMRAKIDKMRVDISKDLQAHSEYLKLMEDRLTTSRELIMARQLLLNNIESRAIELTCNNQTQNSTVLRSDVSGITVLSPDDSDSHHD